MKIIHLKLRQKLFSRNGFSLIEVMIAMVVLSIGLLSLSALQTGAIRGNAKSNNLTQRTVIATNHLEYLLNLPFDHPDLADLDDITAAPDHDPENDGDDNDGDGTTDEADDDGELNYSVTWDITDDTLNKKTISLTLDGNNYGEATTINVRTIRIR